MVAHHASVAAIKKLLAGTQEPPAGLGNEAANSIRSSMEDEIKAVIGEMARQYGLNIFFVSSHREDDNTVGTFTHAQVIDQDPGHNFNFDCVAKHWADFTTRHCGVIMGTNTSTAYPVTFPDTEMDGRPCLPVAHFNWEQERDNLVAFLWVLWVWQGGDGDPDWEAIVEDLDKREYKTVEESRLPEKHCPMMIPGLWEEETVWDWSAHLRSTTGPTGRILAECFDKAFQYRRIKLASGQHHIETSFRQTMHPDAMGKVLYGTPCLQYEERMHRYELAQNDQRMDTDEALIRVENLYPENCHGIVVQAAKNVPELMELWGELRKVEVQNFPVAEEPSKRDIRQWPMSMKHVIRSAEEFAQNYRNWRFPEGFIKWNKDNHPGWQILGLFNWIRENYDMLFSMEAGTALIGYHGVAVIYVAILQCTLNVQLHTQADEAMQLAYAAKDYLIFSGMEFSQLSACSRLLQKLVMDSFRVAAGGVKRYASDHQSRRDAWTPQAWVSRAAKGFRLIMPKAVMCRRSQGVFECTMEDYADEVESGAETESETESPSTKNMDVKPVVDDEMHTTKAETLIGEEQDSSLGTKPHDVGQPMVAETGETELSVTTQDTASTIGKASAVEETPFEQAKRPLFPQDSADDYKTQSLKLPVADLPPIAQSLRSRSAPGAGGNRRLPSQKDQSVLGLMGVDHGSSREAVDQPNEPVTGDAKTGSSMTGDTVGRLPGLNTGLDPTKIASTIEARTTGALETMLSDTPTLFSTTTAAGRVTPARGFFETIRAQSVARGGTPVPLPASAKVRGVRGAAKGSLPAEPARKSERKRGRGGASDELKLAESNKKAREHGDAE